MAEAKMFNLKAACNQVYGNKFLKAGDPFPAPVPEHVALGLIKNHYAELDQSYQTRSRPKIERKDLTADESKEEAQAPDSLAEVAEAELKAADDSQSEATSEADSEENQPQRRSRRQYNRRDLKAEGE